MTSITLSATPPVMGIVLNSNTPFGGLTAAVQDLEFMRERLEEHRDELAGLITLVQAVYGTLMQMKKASFAIVEDMHRLEAAIGNNPDDEGLKDELRARKVYDVFLTNDVRSQAIIYMDTCELIHTRTNALLQLRMQFQDRVAALGTRYFPRA